MSAWAKTYTRGVSVSDQRSDIRGHTASNVNQSFRRHIRDIRKDLPIKKMSIDA